MNTLVRFAVKVKMSKENDQKEAVSVNQIKTDGKEGTKSTEETNKIAQLASPTSTLLRADKEELTENDQINRGMKRTYGELSLGDTGETLEVDKRSKDENPPSPKVLRQGNFAYRLLRENESSSGGLYPKDENAKVSIDDHVASGSSKGFKSQYISACSTYSAVTDLLDLKCKGSRRYVRIMKINLDKLCQHNIIYLNTTYHRNRLSETAKRRADRFDEILIKGSIPLDAYKVIYAGGKKRYPEDEPVCDL